jgi:hypothetical protein
LIYFASGLRLSGVDNQAQLRTTSGDRANVMLHPIDARSGRVGAARRRVAPVARWHRHVHRPAGAQRRLGFQRSRDALLAGQGHRRPRDVRLQRPVARYRPGGAVDDQLLHARLPPRTRRATAEFHRVGSLRGGVAGELAYRRAIGDKEFARFTAADKERQLEETLMLDNPVTDISIAMEVNYFS